MSGGAGAHVTQTTILHATCVVAHGKGVVITGASGRGKSGLALSLMAHGAELVSDDRVILTRQEGRLVASAPEAIRGFIEARGIGLLRAQPYGPAPVDLVVDLDETEQARLPVHHVTSILGQPVTLIYGCNTPYFPAALMQFLKAGRKPE